MKPNIKNITLFLLLIANSALLSAQTVGSTAKISGSLTDENGKPLDYATVSLLKTKDSSAVKGTLSTEAGAYSFEHIAAGNYTIKASSVGYVSAVSLAVTVAEGATVNMPVLKLKMTSRTLGTVTVTASKPLIEQKPDRTVMNVESSVLSAGNSALEILARAPGVSIDKDDNISLKGKDGVTVMINDKLTYLSAAQLGTLLRSTEGSMISTIELITNPSAKYDAAGSSGIINIKLKKSRQSGTSGSVTLSAGYGNGGKDRNSVSLNHQEGKLNVFGSFGHNDTKSSSKAELKRIVTDSTGAKTYFDQNGAQTTKDHNNSYRAGAQYELTAKNTIGFLMNGYFNTSDNKGNGMTTIGSHPAEAGSYQTTPSIMTQSYKNFALNLNDRLKIDTNGQELAIDVDYSKFNNNSNAQYDTYFYHADGSPADSPYFLREQTPSVITIHTAKADYTLPLYKNWKLEAGAKYSEVKTDNNLQAQQFVDGSYINDASLTNRFVYDEKIAAGYVNLSRNFKSTTVQGGLRAERTSSTGDLLTNNASVSRRYLDLFPSLFVIHTLNDKNQLGFSYSRRIDRPNYDDLNPFTYYMDQYTYTKGNPFLSAQYTNKVELNYTYNHAINISLGYSRTTDAISGILLTDAKTKVTVQTQVNLQTENYYNINLNSPYTITKWWSGNFNLTGYYRGFKTDSLLGGKLNDGKFAYLVRTSQTFTLAPAYKAELLSNYRSSLISGIYHVRANFTNDVGISHSFAEKKASIKFSVSDIFNAGRDRVSSNYQTNDLKINQKLETRIARLTISYNFGGGKIKQGRYRSGIDDETGRVKGAN